MWTSVGRRWSSTLIDNDVRSSVSMTTNLDDFDNRVDVFRSFRASSEDGE